MRKTRYIIKPLQAKGRNLPVISFVALWLLCDRLTVPDWLWGIYWFLAIIVFCFFIYDLATHEEKGVDIQNLLFETKENDTPKVIKKDFKTRLNELKEREGLT